MQRVTLFLFASGAGRTKHTTLAARYPRSAARRERKRAAVGHSVLVAVGHLLRDPVALCHDLGPGYFDERHRQAVQRRLVRRLEGLRYTVSLAPPTSAAWADLDVIAAPLASIVWPTPRPAAGRRPSA